MLIGGTYQGIIQKKSASGSRTLRCLVIFFQNFILIRKCQKGSLNRGTLVSATAIYQTKCPFTILSALFLFFQTLPNDSKLFPAYCTRWGLRSSSPLRVIAFQTVDIFIRGCYLKDLDFLSQVIRFWLGLKSAISLQD